MTAGVEEPSAFVEISAPRFEPVIAATMVELEDGVVATGRPGVGRLPLDPPAASEGRAPPRARRAPGRRERPRRDLPGRGGRRRRRPGARRRARADARGGRDGLDAAGGRDRSDQDHGARPLRRRIRRRPRAVAIRSSASGTSGRAAWCSRPEATSGSIAFAGNDRPGVMLAGAAEPLRRRTSASLPGTRAVLFTARGPAYGTMLGSATPGVETAAVVDVRSGGTEPAFDDAETLERLGGHRDRGRRPASRPSTSRGPAARRARSTPTSCSSRAGGTPTSACGGRSAAASATTRRSRASSPTAAAPTGSRSPARPRAPPRRRRSGSSRRATTREKYVDLQRDQTVADVRRAVARGITSVEHVKRATYIGTAIDQGRSSGVVAAEIVNALLGAGPGAQGPTNARPPYTPVSFAALAGPYRGDLLDPIRRTPMHASHVERGAAFENVGQWKRPWYFPLEGESMDHAVAREGLAVRNGVGVMDASTLGKIEVTGPDAAAFLDRMYTNRMSNLAVGRVRYGLMCGLDGMVVRRRRRDAPRRRPLPRHHDDRRRRACPRSLRGVAPDRMAAPQRVLHERHRAVGRRGAQRASCTRGPGGRGDRRRPGSPRRSRSCPSATAPSPTFPRASRASRSRASSRTRCTSRAGTGRTCGTRCSRRARRPTGRRRCTCSAPRRATRSSARTPTVR